MKKTDLDIRREDIAHGLNGRLIGTGISVAGGGRRGPFVVIVERLDRRGLDRVVAAVLAATGGSMRPAEPEGADHA